MAVAVFVPPPKKGCYFKKCLYHHSVAPSADCKMFTDWSRYFAASRKISSLEHSLVCLSSRCLQHCRGCWRIRKMLSSYLLNICVQIALLILFSYETHQDYLWKYCSDRRLFQMMCHHDVLYLPGSHVLYLPGIVTVFSSLMPGESLDFFLSHQTHSGCLLFLPDSVIFVVIAMWVVCRELYQPKQLVINRVLCFAV